MEFQVRPHISDCDSLEEFFRRWQVDGSDLLITESYTLKEGQAPCDCLFKDRYGASEPTDEIVDAMLRQAQSRDYRRIIAIGGGAVMDVAKLFVFGRGLTCEEIFENGALLPRRSGLILVPTTCGTGSEVTSISIVEFIKKQTKIGLSVPAMFADEAVLIPSLLKTLPYQVFAASSIDALIHSVESYLSPKANPFTRSLGRGAMEMILNGYKQLVSAGERRVPQDLHDYLISSTMAGVSFGNAGCAAVHALSYPIGGEYHVPHGKANFAVFEQVVRAYRELGADLKGLENVLRGIFPCGPQEDVWVPFFALLNQVLERIPLSDLNIDDRKCRQMAESVLANQQRLLGNNPVALSREMIETIYRRCL